MEAGGRCGGSLYCIVLVHGAAFCNNNGVSGQMIKQFPLLLDYGYQSLIKSCIVLLKYTHTSYMYIHCKLICFRNYRPLGNVRNSFHLTRQSFTKF